MTKKLIAFGTITAVMIGIVIKLVLFTPYTEAHEAFAQLDATAICQNQLPAVTLAWIADPKADYYRIQRKTNSSDPWVGILDSQIRETQYIDTLWQGDYGAITYLYRIQAVQRKGNGQIVNSNEVSIAVPECRFVQTSNVKFTIGERVAVRSDQPALNIRTSPYISAQVIGTQPANAIGTIVDGPEYDDVDDHWFWKVDYDTGVDGWNVEYWVDPIQTTDEPTQDNQNPVEHSTMPTDMKWGAYVGWQNTAMVEFEQLTGKQPDMEMVFVHWGNEYQFPSYYSRIRDTGKTMVLFWEASNYLTDPFDQEAFSLDNVIAGNLDDYFTTFAEGAREYEGPIILIPYSEMNGNWFSWGGTVGNNSPEKLIAAYRHIHTFFEDIPNVKFGWAPNSNSVPNTPENQMENYYPGDDVVDFVGIDGFNFGGREEQTFHQLFSNPLSRLEKYGKPIYIFSMASAASASKAEWMRQAFTVELYKYPKLEGWLWFNQNKERDWRVNSDPASLETFISVIPE